VISTLTVYSYYHNFYCNINCKVRSDSRTHNRHTQIYMPYLYYCCITCIACTSERKYMFCLTENLQFFLDCNTVSYHITHDRVNLYEHQRYLYIQTLLFTNLKYIGITFIRWTCLCSPEDASSSFWNVRTYVRACVRARARARVCVCVCVCVSFFKMMEKVLLLTGDVLNYFPVDSLPPTWNCHSVQVLKSVGKTWFPHQYF